MTTNPTTEETRMDDTDAPTVCITHGRFIPCRGDAEHSYTDSPFWVKSVRDYQGSDDPNLTWEPVRVETITDRAAIRDSDEADPWRITRAHVGNTTCGCGCAELPTPVPDSGATVAALDLDDIEGRAKAVPDGWDRWAGWQHYQILGLVTPTQIDGWAHPEKRADAMERTEAAVEHIVGMDPATTLALIDRLRSAEAEVARLRAQVAAVEALAEIGTTPDGEPLPEWVSLDDLRAALATTGEGQ